MNKRHYEHTLPNIRGSLSNTYITFKGGNIISEDQDGVFGHRNSRPKSGRCFWR